MFLANGSQGELWSTALRKRTDRQKMCGSFPTSLYNREATVAFVYSCGQSLELLELPVLYHRGLRSGPTTALELTGSIHSVELKKAPRNNCLHAVILTSMEMNGHRPAGTLHFWPATRESITTLYYKQKKDCILNWRSMLKVNCRSWPRPLPKGQVCSWTGERCASCSKKSLPLDLNLLLWRPTRVTKSTKKSTSWHDLKCNGVKVHFKRLL